MVSQRPPPFWRLDLGRVVLVQGAERAGQSAERSLVVAGASQSEQDKFAGVARVPPVAFAAALLVLRTLPPETAKGPSRCVESR